MTTATLTKWVRDPRNGQVHLPREEVTIMGVLHNLDRTLLKVRWQAGGECVLFAEEARGNASGLGKAWRVDRSVGVDKNFPSH